MIPRLRWKAVPRYYFVFVILCSVLFLFKLFRSVPAPYPRVLDYNPSRNPATHRNDFAVGLKEFASVVSRTLSIKLLASGLQAPRNSTKTSESRFVTKAARISVNYTNRLRAKSNLESRKKKLTLFVAILSAPIRIDRREGIRTTWMSDCHRSDVACRFFTDPLSQMKPNVAGVLLNESGTHGDVEFMQVPRGYNFGRRMYWLIQWVTRYYDFDYLLRVDDDYFVCLKRLLYELHRRPPER